MAIWNTMMQGRATVGAESTRFDIRRVRSGVSTKFDRIDLVQTIAESLQPVIWQSPDHGQASPSPRFDHLFILPDPDEVSSQPFALQVELAITDADGDVTTITLQCDKDRPLVLGPSTVAAALTDTAPDAEITRIRFNRLGTEASSFAMSVRTLLLADAP